jgi:hypothetical protein
MICKQRCTVMALVLALFALGCNKSQSPAPPVAPEVQPEVTQPAPKVEDVASTPAVVESDAVVEATKSAPAGNELPKVCNKLLTCCDAWVKVTPTAQVGCDAQRHAFRAAKTPEAKAKLGDLCEQALAAWGQLTDIPDVCK